MAEEGTHALACGCRVVTSRDFLGRGVGRIVSRGPGCPRPDHVAGHTVLMPGRDHGGEGGAPQRP